MKFIDSETTCVDLLIAITPMLTAIFIAYIAWRQWSTAREKLRFDLYARRFQIYDMTIAFYNALSGDVNVDEFIDARRKFLMAVRESQFLFSPDSGIYETLLDLREKAFSIHGFKANRESLQSEPTLFIQLHKKMINELDSWDGLTSKIQKAMASHLNFHS
jgi:hypothetical protein